MLCDLAKSPTTVSTATITVVTIAVAQQANDHRSIFRAHRDLRPISAKAH
jgi:hypothetical protein